MVEMSPTECKSDDVMAHRKCLRKLAVQFTGTVSDQLVLRSSMYMMWHHTDMPPTSQSLGFSGGLGDLSLWSSAAVCKGA